MDSNAHLKAPEKYCASSGCGPFDGWRAWWRSETALPEWEHFADRGCIALYSGRVAIGLLPEVLKLPPESEVLVPAYNCGSEIDPLLKGGLRLRVYRVDRNARIDLEDIVSRVTRHTRAVYVTHYFGWPQDLSELSVWCRTRDLLLIEDCALALFSSGSNGALGRSGDAAIFSLRKSLPLPDGGVLSLAAPVCGRGRPVVSPTSFMTGRAMLPLLKRSLFELSDRLGCYSTARRGLGLLQHRGFEVSKDTGSRPDIPASYYFNGATAGMGMSRTSLGLLRIVDPQLVRARRRENYCRLRAELDGIRGLELLSPDLSDGVCPLCLPVLVGRERRSLVEQLNRRGIEAYPFWEGYHRSLDWNDFPEACELKNEVLTLPVHEGLSAGHMVFIAQTFRGLLPVRGTPTIQSNHSDSRPESRYRIC